MADQKQRKMETKKKICIGLAVVFLLLGVILLSVALSLRYATRATDTEYGIVFDGGSSHTSMFLYQWDSERINGTGKVEQKLSCTAEGDGLSSYSDNPSGAGPSITECLKEASDSLPAGIKQYTPVYLGATAGMRLVEKENESVSTAIIESVRQEVKDSGFQVTDIEEQVQILPGDDEGASLWTTANYFGGLLGVIPYPKWALDLPGTIGVLDLGGASTQVAFESEESNEKLVLFGKTYSVNSESFLCFGSVEMQRQILAYLAKEANYEGEVSDPCYAEGYEAIKRYSEIFESICTEPFKSPSAKDTAMNISGTSNMPECQNVINAVFEVAFPANTTIPPLPKNLFATSTYAYITDDLEITDKSKRTNFSNFETIVGDWCAQTYDEVMESDIFNPGTTCVVSQYIRYLIKDFYKVADEDWGSIIFAVKVGDVELGWTPGYMTNATTSLPSVPRIPIFEFSTAAFIACLVIAIMLIVLGIAAAVAACKFSRQQYHSVST